MNDTNNSSENTLNSESIKNEDVQSVPVEEKSENVVSISNENTNNPTSSEIVVSSAEENKVEDVTDVKSEDNTLSKSEEEVRSAKLRFPYIVTILIVVFLILFIIYYFFLISPQRLYKKVLKISVDKIANIVDIYNSSEEYVNSNINMKIDTVGTEIESKDNLSYIDGYNYNFKFKRDNKNQNFALDINTNSDNSSNFVNPDNIKTSMYYVSNNIYSKPLNNYIAVRDNIGNDVEHKYTDLFSEFIYEFINNINVDKVQRSLDTTKVNNQTLLAVKYSLDYNSDDIKMLLSKTSENILDTNKHAEFVKNVANILDTDESVIKNIVKKISEVDVSTSNLKFNYYMNISFTNLICMELITDDFVFTISYLDDYYFIYYNDMVDDGVEVDLAINFDTFDLSGDVLINTKSGYSRFVIDSSYEIDDKAYNLSKNEIFVKVYDDNKNKPYLILTTNVGHTYNNEVPSKDKLKAIKRVDASDEEIKILEYCSKKTTYEFAYLFTLLTKNKISDNPNDILSNMNDNSSESDTPDVNDSTSDSPVVATQSE